MKGKELYERFLHVGAKINSELTTQKRTAICAFVENLADRFIRKYTKAEERMNFDSEWSDVYTAIYELGTVQGYIIGQLFDFKDPEILRNLEVIKKELVKEGLFSFTPRVR
jgi:hypothetical protein